MIDEKQIELMNGEIDGVNSPEESQELQKYLDAHPEARSHYDELCQLDHMVKESKRLIPPEQLKGSILSSIFERTEQPDRKGFMAAVGAFLKQKPSRKLLYAFATGLIVGLFLFALLSQITPGGKPVDFEKLYGTLSIMKDEKALFDTDPIDFKLVGASGYARVRYTKERIFFELNLLSESESQVILQYDPSVQFEAVSVTGAGKHKTDVRINEIRLTHSGSRSYLFLLKDDHQTSTPILVKIFTDEGSAFEKTIYPRRN